MCLGEEPLIRVQLKALKAEQFLCSGKLKLKYIARLIEIALCFESL